MNPFLSVSDSSGIKEGAGDPQSPSLSRIKNKFSTQRQFSSQRQDAVATKFREAPACKHPLERTFTQPIVSKSKSGECVSVCPAFLDFGIKIFPLEGCLRPYHLEYTSSCPITEVKQGRDLLVLGWVTAWEYRLL